MSDPANALVGRKKRSSDPPDSPRSVGWVTPQHALLASAANPLPLDCGRHLAPVSVEYETYGALNAARDNAILILHALSGDAHVAGWDATNQAPDCARPWRHWCVAPDGSDREHGKSPNWWDTMIGPGKAFDTNHFCVICANVLGSCYGTTGPSSLDPATGRPYGLSFPAVTVRDWVRLHARLLDHLGIDQLYAAAGGSLGGQQVIELGLAFPERVRGLMVLAASPRLSNQGIALNYAARHAIINDPWFARGDYYDAARRPDAGLGIARMIGHITYLSEMGMELRFDPGRRPSADLVRGLYDPHRLALEPGGYVPGNEFDVESYLTRQAEGFIERFDPNSYLYITKAMDYYSAADWGDGDLGRAAARARGRWLVASFTSDWLYPPASCRRLADALCANSQPVTYVNIESDYGHDAFLLEVDTLERLIVGFLEGVARHG
ncbi:MAG: homoserine O-acetyltransferase [Fimbriimonadaceae bacterium]|nr:homoserine O-acetyltransferase [Fimbriimonadaceae bacterium]